jgi:bacillithiol synthase
LINTLVKRESIVQLSLQKEQQALYDIYQKLKTISTAVDATLAKHTEALQVQALKKIAILEKKMLRAEKKKFEVQQRKLHKLKTALFPNNNLQERIENIIPFYAKWGDDFIKTIYENSLGLQQEFVVLEED